MLIDMNARGNNLSSCKIPNQYLKKQKKYLRGEQERAGRVYEGGLYILLGKEVRYWDAHQKSETQEKISYLLLPMEF